MRFTKYSIFFITLLFTNILSQAVIPERKGWWKFDNPANITKAENGFGSDLTLVGKHTSEAGPNAGNGAVLIGPGSYYKMNHQITPKVSETFVNEYSLQVDFKIPETGVWHSFFQTSAANDNDGDFFINTSGNIGVAAVGYSNYSILKNEWYRLLVSVKNGSFFTCYLDGKLLMTGSTQTIDGRFSLNQILLIFADEDGEDGTISCSELAIWDKALTSEQAKELGGYGHLPDPFIMTRIPYLQGQGQNSMNICWHDTAISGTKVEFGLDSTLKLSAVGTSELINDPYRWHSVKLSGLTANTRYFYRVVSGNGVSKTYAFKTLPDETYAGKIRFVLFSDTHDSDTTSAKKVMVAAKAKISELYGADIENHVNGIFHSGDLVVSGNSPGQYTTQYFQPISVLSGNIPTMAVAGNHEGESQYFYKYMKLNDQSAYPSTSALNEKIWQTRVGSSVFIGLNTNIIDQYGTTQANWLDAKLKETENDASIDFVFLFMHHPPFSELWFDVSTFDGGANYVKNTLFPIIRKYTKVQQLNSGHTHGFERGTVVSDKSGSDFRFIIGGGGGGPLDNWGDFTNLDYPDIHIALDHFCFQILEIDIANHSYQNSMYSLGNQFKSRNSELLDKWYKKVNQSGPSKPTVENVLVNPDNIQFNTSQFSGVDSLMTVEMQVTELSIDSPVILDHFVHWKDIYEVDKNYIPIDQNSAINLYQLKINKSMLAENKSYLYRVRYRDHNLKWSLWADAVSFNTNGIISGIDGLNNSENENQLGQNFPNPFSHSTIFPYQIQKSGNVSFQILDLSGNEIRSIDEGVKSPGNYDLEIYSEKLENGIYFLRMKTSEITITRKMIVSR